MDVERLANYQQEAPADCRTEKVSGSELLKIKRKRQNHSSWTSSREQRCDSNNSTQKYLWWCRLIVKALDNKLPFTPTICSCRKLSKKGEIEADKMLFLCFFKRLPAPMKLEYCGNKVHFLSQINFNPSPHQPPTWTFFAPHQHPTSCLYNCSQNNFNHQLLSRFDDEHTTKSWEFCLHLRMGAK